jgi:hypothetical protein
MALVLTSSGLLFAGVGVGLALAVNPILGAVFVFVGLTDLAMALFFRRRSEAGVRTQADPSSNPYAQED